MTPYEPLMHFSQFIIWKLVPSEPKPLKLPCDPTGRVSDAHLPSNWMTFDAAKLLALAYGDNYGVAFVFTKADPFFVVDIDGCLGTDGNWSQLSLDLIASLPNALVEVSQSGRGLHIIGSGVIPDHAKKNTSLNIEMYHDLRFLALGNMETATGSAGVDLTHALPDLISKYFPFTGNVEVNTEWTTEPVTQWAGPSDDIELLSRMFAVKPAATSAFLAPKTTLKQLWDGDADALSLSYPDTYGSRAYDGSSADAALAQHLAFYTGKNCDRMLRMMRMSGLVRDKWDREDYLVRTIQRAVSLQVEVYCRPETPDISHLAPAKLKGSPDQVKYAESIRAEKIAMAPEGIQLAQIDSAAFWIDNRLKLVEELLVMITPNPLIAIIAMPIIKTGLQYLGATQQLEVFEGCVYVQDAHKVFTPDGVLLSPDRFNASYGGYLFQFDDSGTKTTKKAFEAFTESQLVAYPIAKSTCFRPELPSGKIVDINGASFVNTYVPDITRRVKGDPTPFLTHLAKVLPDKRDRTILTAYMAAVIQHIGVKFQWAPLLQGVEGNGKTLFTRCVEFAIGPKYTHFPPANEIAEKFNEWLFDKVFIGIEDVYVSEHKKEVIEVLKPMITNDRLTKRAMQQGQVTCDVRANFMLNSNHKDAIRKTEADRRFAVFYTAQQTSTDLIRDGMSGNYFPNLYKWLRADGYAIVNEYLNTYPIPEEFNPATNCNRAPKTSSTDEAITSSLGSVEQEVMEAISEGRVGFKDGWISSVALDKLLDATRKSGIMPPNKRRAMLSSLGYEYHPDLTDGRVNNPVAIDDGKKPRLYIQKGHVHYGLKGAAEISHTYQRAQGAIV